jgi:hypothetical protein
MSKWAERSLMKARAARTTAAASAADADGGADGPAADGDGDAGRVIDAEAPTAADGIAGWLEPDGPAQPARVATRIRATAGSDRRRRARGTDMRPGSYRRL